MLIANMESTVTFQVMSMLDPQTVHMFHFSGPKHTTPNCPVDLAPNFNPSSGAQSYSRSTKDCIRNSIYNIPFFLDRPKKFEEWSVNAHEARPGHHTQVNHKSDIYFWDYFDHWRFRYNFFGKGCPKKGKSVRDNPER